MPSLTLAEFQATDLPISQVISGQMDRVHDCFLGFDYEVVSELPDEGGDMVVIIDHMERKRKLERLARHGGRIVLVAAPIDGPFWTHHFPSLKQIPSNLQAAFLANNDIADPRVTNIPVGVRIGKTEPLLRVRRNRDTPREGLLYGNFNMNPSVYFPGPDGVPHIRARLHDQFGSSTWATIDVSERHRPGEDTLVHYYEQIARHRFALSPEGLGADCYRHWECLYLGTIPIVRASTTMESFSDLPILFTDDYSEIDAAYLDAQWDRYDKRRFALDRLMKSYYRKRFLNSVARLSSPRFLCWGFRGTSEEDFLDELHSAA